MTIVRPTMTHLIDRVRLLVNDPRGASQIFDDSDIQDVMDESRVDVKNGSLIAKPTFVNSSLQYLDYWYEIGGVKIGGWEDSAVLKQYLTVTVTPSVSEPIAGHWQFAASTLPPVFISGSVHDVYHAAADLLERWAAKWVLSYNVSVDGQNLQRGQATTALQALAHTYRLKQRPGVIMATRSDLAGAGGHQNTGILGPRDIDYFSSGDGR